MTAIMYDVMPFEMRLPRLATISPMLSISGSRTSIDVFAFFFYVCLAGKMPGSQFSKEYC